MAAKLAAISVLTVAITVPLALIDFVLLLVLGLVDSAADRRLSLPVVLGAGLFSVASAIAVALFARDIRTANNLSGLFMGPMILLALGFSVLFLPWGFYRACSSMGH